MPNIFDPIGSAVDAALAALWTIVTTILQNATQAMLMGTITLLMTSPWPDLASPTFKALWNNGFGLVLLASLVYLIIAAGFSAFSSKDSSLGETTVWVLKNFAVGAFMLLLVLAGMAIADILMQLMAMLFAAMVGSPDWGNVLLQDRNYGQADALAQWIAFNVTTTNSTLLYMQASISGGALMMYLLWYLFAGLLGNGMLGKIVRSMLLAVVFTQVFARVIQVGFLGIGAIITQWGIDSGFTPIAFAMTAAITSSAALIVPTIMIIVLTVRFYKHERALDPHAIMQSLSSQKMSGVDAQKLNSRRAELMTSAKEHGSELGREVLKTAAIAAAVAGIAKVTSMVLAKIPTPQTKVAALGVAAIGVGSKALQNHTSARIGARVGRVGRPTSTPSKSA